MLQSALDRALAEGDFEDLLQHLEGGDAALLAAAALGLYQRACADDGSGAAALADVAGVVEGYAAQQLISA